MTEENKIYVGNIVLASTIVILWHQKRHCLVRTEGLSSQLKWPELKADHLPLSVPNLKRSGARRATRTGPAGLQPPKKKFKKTLFESGFQRFLRDWPFSLNQPLKSADNWSTGILKNIIKIQKVLDDLKKRKIGPQLYLYVHKCGYK